MGITGLLPFIRNSCRPVNIRDFKGSAVAIDAYSWLHKGAFGCAEKLIKGEKTDGYIFYCMKQLNMLLEAGLKPIMVFDGCHLPSKEVTEKKRRENRESTRLRGKQLLCEGKIKEARECFQRCVDVTPEMAREVIEACRTRSIDCIVAPYEADSQLAYLDKINVVQLIITEDSDLVLFGCNRVLFKMDSCGGGLLYEKENLSKSFGNKALKFSFEKFRYMCILSGCDYLPSLSGIGLAKAFKFFSLTTNTDLSIVLSKLPSYLKMPKLVVPKEYIESFVKANNTFLYQLVFCSQKKKLVPLNPYPEGMAPEDMEYAGRYLPDDLACQLAMGDINVKTMKAFESSWSEAPSINEDKSVLWGSQSTKMPAKVQQTAFIFNSAPKEKKPTFTSKRPFVEMANSSEDLCTDEELFAMYGGTHPKKPCLEDNTCAEEPIPLEDDLDFQELPDGFSSKSPSPDKSHPKTLNIPYKKIVRSRFFSSTPNNLNSSEGSLLDQSLQDSPSLPESSISPSIEVEVPNEVATPKKDSREYLMHRFAKKKTPTTETQTTVDDKKNDSWQTIIDRRNVPTSVAVSSPDLSSQLKSFSFKNPHATKGNNMPGRLSKKLRTTKMDQFTTKHIPLSSSLGSDGNSHEESLEESSVSPYFLTPSSTASSQDTALIDISGESEDLDGQCSSLTEQCDTNVPKTLCNSLMDKKPLNNKNSKPGRCRTLGLSKIQKGKSKVLRKETLLNFNFVRQPKEEVATIS